MDKVLLLEDYEEWRILLMGALLKAFGKAEIIEAVNVAEARKLITSHYFDLAILDLDLPDGSGIEIIEKLRAISPDTVCVVATASDDDQALFDSLKAGAHGYLLKEEPRKELIKHLQGMLDGQPPLSPSIARKMISYFKKSEDAKVQSIALGLTDREKQVLQLIAKGAPRKTIAKELDISLHTANDHVKAVYRKLNVSSSVAATRIAIEQGLS